jgi:hypothetical protein
MNRLYTLAVFGLGFVVAWIASRYIWPQSRGPVGLGCVRCSIAVSRSGGMTRVPEEMGFFNSPRKVRRFALSHGWVKEGKGFFCPQCANRRSAFVKGEAA